MFGGFPFAAQQPQRVAAAGTVACPTSSAQAVAGRSAWPVPRPAFGAQPQPRPAAPPIAPCPPPARAAMQAPPPCAFPVPAMPGAAAGCCEPEVVCKRGKRGRRGKRGCPAPLALPTYTFWQQLAGDGGAGVAGQFVKRPLNAAGLAVPVGSTDAALLPDGGFALGPGTYVIDWSAIAFACIGHIAALCANVIAPAFGVPIKLGSAGVIGQFAPGEFTPVQTLSVGTHTLVLTATSTQFCIAHAVELASTVQDLGNPANIPGQLNLYVQVKIQRVA